MHKKNIVPAGLLLGALAILGAFAFAANPTEAARGSKGPGGSSPPSIIVNQANPRMGDVVTFTTNGGSRISVACYQGGLGNMVYSADQATGTAFTLRPGTAWSDTGGDALCYAWLYSRSLSRGSLASTTFTASAP